METNIDELNNLLETAIDDGNTDKLLHFLCRSEDADFLDIVMSEIGNYIKEILSTDCPHSQPKITNILNIIWGLSKIATFGLEITEYSIRCMLNIAVDQCCSIDNLKHALIMLKELLSEEHILGWASSDESLFVPIKQLGVKLINIGDYECQSMLLETLLQISEPDRNFWAPMWFFQEKATCMFLNMNPETFMLECRKFLNYINRNEKNTRTFAFVAISVCLGSVQLKKPYGSEFWIDFNHDTQSISFFYSSLTGNEETWETVLITSEIVEGYCIKEQKSKTTKLLITLNQPCSQLLSLEDSSMPGLESHLIQITFSSIFDFRKHVEALFKRSIPYPKEESFHSTHFKQKRRASEPKDLVCSNDYQEQVSASQNRKKRRASEPIEILCASNAEEMVNQLHKPKRRVSESSQLVLVGTQGDTICETYAEVDNELYHTENLQFEDTNKQKEMSFNKVIDLLEEDQNLDYGSPKTQKKSSQQPSQSRSKRQSSQVSTERNAASNKTNSQNAELLEISSLSPRKSSQVSIERIVPSTKRSQTAELLQISSLSPRKSSQGIVPSTKRSQNAELLEVPSLSPRKSSQVSIERIVPSTKRSQISELLEVPSMSPKRSSPASIVRNDQRTMKESKNSQLLEALCNSPRNPSEASFERHLQSTPNRSQNVVYENSPRLSPILAVTENYIQENISPRSVSNNLPTEDQNDLASETVDNQSKMNMAHDTNKVLKRHKSANNNKGNEDNYGPEESTDLFDGEDPQISSVFSPERKSSRKAAANARKRNKLILEQKGSETSFEGTQQAERQNRVEELREKQEMTSHKRKMLDRDKSEDRLENNSSKPAKKRKVAKKADPSTEDDEYVFKTSPPLVSRRKRKRSVFVTDTETGSSEVSWLNKFSLFETPTKSYSKGKKSTEKKKKKTVKEPRKPKKAVTAPSSIAQPSDTESRPKSAVSEYKLVIVKEKKSLPPVELSGLFRSLKRNSRHSSTIEDNFQSENQEAVNPDGYFENDNSIQLNNNDNISSVSENLATEKSLENSNNAKQPNFRSSTDEKTLYSNNEPEVSSKRKRSSKNSNVLPKNKNLKEVNRSKKRLADETIPKPSIKKSKNVEHSVSIDINSTANVDFHRKKQKNSIHQGSDRNIFNSVENTLSNNGQSYPIALETVVEVSPFKRNEASAASKIWVSPNKIFEIPEEEPNLEGMNTLTERSLNGVIGDEKKGKQMHMQYFLESLSSLSPNPEPVEETEIAEDFPTLPIIEKPSKERLIHHSTTGEQTAKSRLKRPKDHTFKRPRSDFAQEDRTISSSLQCKSVHQNKEKPSDHDILNPEPSERSFQAASTLFEKAPTNYKKLPEHKNSTNKSSVLHILSNEVNSLTFKLFCTLKKCMSDFRQKMVALRGSIVKTADSMLANESMFTEKDLQSLARNCKESRLQIQKHLKKLCAMGNEYFESEKKLEKQLSKKNKKAVIKYTKSLQIAQNIAEKALEERFLLKSKVFLKSFLKKMELV